MRLLHFDALGRLALTDFRGKRIPPYAILSHRWSDSEILIEDIASEMYKKKEQGYKKLMFCAGQAARDKLKYFWIDTCCIDRWNNNERSRAINSMFQWYKDATRCYVFLSDVSVSTAIELVQRSDWEASFRASAWFIRGWTLQELIAPVSVEFFSCEGLRIGDKMSLDQLLHTITSIPLAALRNCPLNQFSISERMRWAENRVTTEEEDIVYCLLGLLSVSMPATYGEGQQSALERLQAEIQGASSAPSIIPFSRNKAFVGREPQLAELEAKLFSNKQTTTTLAIVGPGGTGKSQLALEIAHRVRQHNTDCAVFWMDASHKDSLYQSYASVAQKLSIPGWNNSDLVDIKQVIKHCVVELSERQCLLVFDNLDDITLLSDSLSAVDAIGLADYLPQSTRCSVIFTTTSTKMTEMLAPQNVIALHKLTADTALRMLQNSLSRPLSPIEQQQSVPLLRELLYLPIAIVQAAACISASEMTVQEYAIQLDKHKNVVHEYNNDLLEHRPQNCGLGSPIAATLSLSISQVRHRNTIAADYLFLAACVDRRDIALDLLEASSPQAREDSIKMLDKYALITRRPAESALDVHRLVHDALRTRLQVQGQLQYWTQRVITQLVQMFPNGDYSDRSKWRRLLPHALFALLHSQTEDSDEKRLDLIWKCAKSLYSDGIYKKAEELFVEVMQTQKRVLGEEHPDTLKSMANLASTYWSQERWGEAEELFVEVVQIQKRVLGEEHPDTLNGMANLATTYWNQRRPGEAEELFVQVMQTRKRVLGEEHPSTLASIANLALTYRNQKQLGEAEELFIEVMQTQKRVLGEEHPDMLKSMASLALIYSDQGRWGEAEELEMQVMQTRKKVLGEEHPDTLSIMANLASTYWNQRRWGEAGELELQVMQTKKRVLGERHPSTLTSMENLAFTLQSQARRKEALALMETCFLLRQEVFGEKHHDTQSSLNTLHTWRADCSDESL